MKERIEVLLSAEETATNNTALHRFFIIQSG